MILVLQRTSSPIKLMSLSPRSNFSKWTNWWKGSLPMCAMWLCEMSISVVVKGISDGTSTRFCWSLLYESVDTNGNENTNNTNSPLGETSIADVFAFLEWTKNQLIVNLVSKAIIILQAKAPIFYAENISLQVCFYCFLSSKSS